MNDEVLVCDNLTLGYDRHPAVHHLDFVVHRGALVGIAGPNGGGKSTLLKGIAAVLVPLGGRIVVSGGRRRMAYLPQRTELDSGFPITVFDVVAMGMWREVGAWGRFGPRGDARIAQALEAVNMSGFERRPIGSLSGGQGQRVLFARLLLQDADLILLDEPFNAIDSATVTDLMALIGQWHAEGRTILAVLHDLEQLRAHFPETLLLAREKVASGTTAAVLTREHLDRARSFAEAFDVRARSCGRG